MSRNGTRDKLGVLDKLFPGYGEIVIQLNINRLYIFLFFSMVF